MPKRIQRKRSKGWRMPPNTVYVGRGSAYGNPFKVGEFPSIAYGFACREIVADNAMAVALFRRLTARELNPTKPTADAVADKIIDLRGKDLACWCALDVPCHADVLLELANK